LIGPDLLPPSLRRARAALRALGWAEAIVAVAALVVICAINAVGVVLRYGFNGSLIWSGEVSGLLAKGCYALSIRSAACLSMRQAKATTWKPARVEA
jgi:TRAP-type C4-dicarboxylate transport system permease small subunit